MIDLSTLADLLERGHQLAAYCPRCRRWATLPLAELVAGGQGGRSSITTRCQDCGSRGELQVRPPAPTLDPHRAG